MTETGEKGMTHEAGIEAAVAAGDNFPGMSCFVNSKQRNEAWVTAIIKAYLSASGMVLVPRDPTEGMIEHMTLIIRRCAWGRDNVILQLKGLMDQAPNPFKG